MHGGIEGGSQPVDDSIDHLVVGDKGDHLHLAAASGINEGHTSNTPEALTSSEDLKTKFTWLFLPITRKMVDIIQ